MELTPRLQTIADCVPSGALLADVGTDHGYLPVWLLLNGRIDRAIATDLRPGPLGRARETAGQFGQTGRISFRLCDGLAGVSPEETDVAVIAGMGGETIASILCAAPWTREDKLLLLQPMSGAPKLRKWLQEHGYAIQKEIISREGNRLYSILMARGGMMPPMSMAELWAGKNNADPLRLDYLEMVEQKVDRVLTGHRTAQSPDLEAIRRLEAVAEGLREMKKELNS